MGHPREAQAGVIPVWGIPASSVRAYTQMAPVEASSFSTGHRRDAQ
jgi:hypothetical protein